MQTYTHTHTHTRTRAGTPSAHQGIHTKLLPFMCNGATGIECVCVCVSVCVCVCVCVRSPGLPVALPPPSQLVSHLFPGTPAASTHITHHTPQSAMANDTHVSQLVDQLSVHVTQPVTNQQVCETHYIASPLLSGVSNAAVPNPCVPKPCVRTL